MCNKKQDNANRQLSRLPRLYGRFMTPMAQLPRASLETLLPMIVNSHAQMLLHGESRLTRD